MYCWVALSLFSLVTPELWECHFSSILRRVGRSIVASFIFDIRTLFKLKAAPLATALSAALAGFRRGLNLESLCPGDSSIFLANTWHLKHLTRQGKEMNAKSGCSAKSGDFYTCLSVFSSTRRRLSSSPVVRSQPFSQNLLSNSER